LGIISIGGGYIVRGPVDIYCTFIYLTDKIMDFVHVKSVGEDIFKIIKSLVRQVSVLIGKYAIIKNN